MPEELRSVNICWAGGYGESPPDCQDCPQNLQSTVSGSRADRSEEHHTWGESVTFSSGQIEFELVIQVGASSKNLQIKIWHLERENTN